MSETLAASLMRTLRRSGFRPPEISLPGGQEVVDPGQHFAFEAPWPWYELPSEEVAGGSSLRAAADVAVLAPRSDGRDPVFGLRVQTERLDLGSGNPRSESRSHAKAAGVRWRSMRKLLIDGHPALLTEGAAAAEELTFLLLASRGEVLVTGRCDVPASAADGYRQHVESMLATWQWGS